MISPELGRTLMTDTGSQHILPFVTIVETSEVTDQLIFLLFGELRGAAVFQRLSSAHSVVSIIIGREVEILHPVELPIRAHPAVTP